MHNYPQIVTQISNTEQMLTTVIDAPWVSVTSINGMTGDVITEANILDFTPNRYYRKNTLIYYNNNLYWAKQNFTSSSTFNPSDWQIMEASYDWSNITGKPTFATVATSGDYTDLSNTPNLSAVATSGSYTDLSNTPNLADVATSGQYSDLLGAPNLASVATSGSYNDLSNKPNLATVATSGRYTDLINKPTNLVSYDISSTTTNQPWVGSGVIIDGAVTNDKLAGNIPPSKLLDSETSTDNGWTKIQLWANIILYFRTGSYNKTWNGSTWVNSTVVTKPSSLDTSKPFAGSVSSKANDNAINTSGWINGSGSVIVQEYNCYSGSVTTTVNYNAIIIQVL